MRRKDRALQQAPEEQRHRLVVVDDDIVVGMTLSIGLSASDIIEASRPGDGLERVRDSAPDAVIVDRWFPGADGLDLVRALRADPSTSDLPIVVLTASFDEADRADVEAAGADAYLGKPFEPQDLFDVVLGLVGRGAAARQLTRAEAEAKRPPTPPKPAPAPAPARKATARRSAPLRASRAAEEPAAAPASEPESAETPFAMTLEQALDANARLVRHVATAEAELTALRNERVQDASESQHLSVATDGLQRDLARAEATIVTLREQLAVAQLAAQEVDQLRRELSRAYADIDLLGGEASDRPAAPPAKRPAKKKPAKAPAKKARGTS